MMRDIRDALRQWRASPAVTAVAIVSLALGIGANTAIFSVLNALLLKPLPGEEPHRIVSLHQESRVQIFPRGEEHRVLAARITYPAWTRLRDTQTALASVAAHRTQLIDISPPGENAVQAAAGCGPSSRSGGQALTRCLTRTPAPAMDR
jgi:hypothetical protein